MWYDGSPPSCCLRENRVARRSMGGWRWKLTWAWLLHLGEWVSVLHFEEVHHHLGVNLVLFVAEFSVADFGEPVLGEEGGVIGLRGLLVLPVLRLVSLVFVLLWFVLSWWLLSEWPVLQCLRLPV